MHAMLPVGNKARLADGLDLLAIQWDQSTVGTGSITFDDLGDTAHERLHALTLDSPAKSGGTADNATVQVRPSRRASATVTTGDTLGFDRSKEVWFFARMECGGTASSTNQHIFLRAFDGGGTNRVLQFYRSNGNQVHCYLDAGLFGGSGTVYTSTVTVPEDEPFDLRVQYVSATSNSANDGVLKVWVWRDGDSDWVSVIDETAVDCNTGIGYLHLMSLIGPGGASNGTYNYVTRYTDVSVGYSQAELSETVGTFDQRAAFNRVDPTTLKARLLVGPDAYNDATHGRLRWASGSSVATDGGSTTDWVALNSYSDGSQTVPLTFFDASVPANSEVAFRFELGDGTDMTLQSGVYNCPSQPAAGSNTPVCLHVGSCFDQYAGQHREWDALVDEVASLGWTLHKSIINGDRGNYEDLPLNSYFNGEGVEKFTEAVAYIVGFESDPYYPKYAKTTPQLVQADDHPFNNFDSTWDGSATLLSAIASRPQWDNLTADQNDAFDIMRRLSNEVWGPLKSGSEGTDKAYGSFDIGRVKVVYLDTRFHSDQAGNACLGATQTAWYRSICQNLSTSTPILVTLFQGCPNRWNDQTDSPGTFALTEMRALATNREADLPTHAQYLDIYGDSHEGFSMLSNIEGNGGTDLTDDRFIFQGLASPMGQSLRGTAPDYTGATTIDTYSPSVANDPTFGGGVTVNAEMARFTGMVLRIDPVTPSLAVKLWRVDDDGSNVLLLDETPALGAVSGGADAYVRPGLSVCGSGARGVS